MPRAKLASLRIGPQSYSSSPSDNPLMSLLFSNFKPNNTQIPIDIGANLGGFGNLGHPVDLTRKNIRVVSPSGEFKPSFDEWAQFAQFFMNGAGTVVGGTTTFTFGSASVNRWMEYTDTMGVIHRLLGLAVSRAVIAGSAAQEVTLGLDMVGTDWTNPSTTTYPNWSNTTRLLFADMGLTLGGTATPCRSFSLEIDHGIKADRYYSGFVNSGPLNLDRRVMLRLSIPYGLAVAAWAAGQSDTGLAAVLTFTAIDNGVTSTMTLTLPAIRYAHPDIEARVPDEQFIDLEAQCFGPTQSRTSSGVTYNYTGSELTLALTP